MYENERAFIFLENFWMKTQEHLISSQTIALVYLLHELGYEASLVGNSAILPHLRLLIQQYFDIADYVGSPSVKSHRCSICNMTSHWDVPVASFLSEFSYSVSSVRSNWLIGV
jgi:hypothetical protein